MTEELSRQMNDLYRGLEYRCMLVYNALHHRVFSLESEYRTRHSYFDEQGTRISDDYPLPYVEAAGYCEFQVEPDCLSCFTKLICNDPLSRDYLHKDHHKNCSIRLKASGKSPEESVSGIGHSDIRGLVTNRLMVRREF